MSHNGLDHVHRFEENEPEPEGEPEDDDDDEDEDEDEDEVQPMGPKKPVSFNIFGQPIDDGSTQFSSYVGKMARTHCSPIFTEWPAVPLTSREHVWNTVYNAYDIGLDRKAYVMDSARVSWKDWKYRLRRVYDKYPTNAERKLHKPKRVKKEDWEMFIVICSSADEKHKREKGKAARGNMKLPHTSGRHGAARTAEVLKKQSVDGKVTRTQLFTVLHTHPDGSCLFPESRPILDDINRRVSLDPSLVDRDLDNDAVVLATKKKMEKVVLKQWVVVSRRQVLRLQPHIEKLLYKRRGNVKSSR